MDHLNFGYFLLVVFAGIVVTLWVMTKKDKTEPTATTVVSRRKTPTNKSVELAQPFDDGIPTESVPGSHNLLDKKYHTPRPGVVTIKLRNPNSVVAVVAKVSQRCLNLAAAVFSLPQKKHQTPPPLPSEVMKWKKPPPPPDE